MKQLTPKLRMDTDATQSPARCVQPIVRPRGVRWKRIKIYDSDDLKDCYGYDLACWQVPEDWGYVWQLRPSLLKNRLIWKIDLCSEGGEFTEWLADVCVYELDEAKRFCEHPDAYESPIPPSGNPRINLMRWINSARARRFREKVMLERAKDFFAEANVKDQATARGGC